MPEITLNIPANSKFKSSLNEIDCAMQQILLNQMRIADPRNILGKQGISANVNKNDWLWDNSRVFQVDELTTEEIFDTYLLRKKINNKKGADVSYPILAYLQNDIETVFWGTGNRFRQWFLDTDSVEEPYKIDDEVVILEPFKYRGLHATIATIFTDGAENKFTLNVNNKILTELVGSVKTKPVIFNEDQIKHTDSLSRTKYKAKPITGKYTAVVLVDNRDEAQYLRDQFILKCADAQIWHKYFSPTIESENQIFTVFGIPNIDRYPASQDKIKGSGYIYGISFVTNIWACLTDSPLPKGFIDTIRMNIHVENENRVNRIVITE